MIGEGFELMLVGMGVVFSFLVLLVILMKISGSLLSKLPEPEVAVAPSSGSSSAGGPPSGARSGEASAKLAVALAAAHRAQKGA